MLMIILHIIIIIIIYYMNGVLHCTLHVYICLFWPTVEPDYGICPPCAPIL